MVKRCYRFGAAAFRRTHKTRSDRPRKVNSNGMHQMLQDKQNPIPHKLRILNYLMNEYKPVGTKSSAVNSYDRVNRPIRRAASNFIRGGKRVPITSYKLAAPVPSVAPIALVQQHQSAKSFDFINFGALSIINLGGLRSDFIDGEKRAMGYFIPTKTKRKTKFHREWIQ